MARMSTATKLHKERGRHQRAGDQGEGGVDGGARGQDGTDLAGENADEDGANIARDHQQGGLIDVHAVQVMCGKRQQEDKAHLGGVDKEDHEDGPHVAAVSKELRGDYGVLGVADVDDETHDAKGSKDEPCPVEFLHEQGQAGGKDRDEKQA